MKKELVDRAEADAKAQAQGEPLPLEAPQAPPKGISGVLRVQHAPVKAAPRPWRVHGARDAYVCRVASPAEGAAVAAAYEAAGDKLRGLAPKAMRSTVKRMARQVIEGQLPLPLGDGLDGVSEG